MAAMRSLLALVVVFLGALSAALPQVVPPNQPRAGNVIGWTGLNVNLSSDVNTTFADSAAGFGGPGFVDLYKDKNEAHSTIIDPSTCRGNAEIALMKWRNECKALGALWRFPCWTKAPSFQRCCPLPTKKSCTHYWPKKGEWAKCLRMRQDCGPDCNWKALTNSVHWCWKWAPDM